MPSKKIRVGLIFGGKSAEHEVSIQSARNVFLAIDKNKYDVVLIGIDKQGRWYYDEAERFLLHADSPDTVYEPNPAEEIALIPGEDKQQFVKISDPTTRLKLDVVFPVLHGTCGEDGTVQGVLKLLNIPFVGAGVLGSAVGMDKDVMKRLLRDALIPTPEFLVFHDFQKDSINFNQIGKTLGSPCYVKPANLGSSVGIHRVTSESELKAAVEDAFQYDTKNEFPEASVPGEIITNREKHQFYSYEAKYLDQNGALLQIPAELEPQVAEKIRDLAVRSYRAICCEGMARVDFFLRNETEIYVNELNTIPGFTIISMYPKLWEASGISYSELIDRLIQLALQRQEKERKLKTSVE